MPIRNSLFGRGVFTLVIASACAGLAASIAEAENGAHAHHQNGDAHAQHRAMMDEKGYVRKVEAYQVPDVTLTDQDGNKIDLANTLEGPKPVMLNFIFTTCTTICPVLSASFSQTQQSLAPGEAEQLRMVSISIDPEHDTPAKLREYAQQFKAQPGWQFLTGDLEDIVAVLKAFDAYRGDKMNHIPLTFLRASPQARWTRLEGFASSKDLLRVYRELASQDAS